MTDRSTNRSRSMFAAGLAGSLLCVSEARPTPRPVATTGVQAAQAQSVTAGVYSDQQAIRGEKVFQSQCASCHAAASRSSDSTAPALSGAAFMERWSDQPVSEIFQTMRTTMPPSAPASLSREMYVDILAFVLKANKYPPGSSDLPPDLSKLAQITMVAQP